MPVNLSINAVPLTLAARLKRRAARNHRPLQREPMPIVEAAAQEQPADGHAATVLAANAFPAPAYAVTRLPSGAEARGGASTDHLLDELDADSR